MSDVGRAAVAARVFSLAALIPLALLFSDRSSAPAVLLVVLLATVTCLASLSGRFPEGYVALAEAVAVSVLVVLAHPGSDAVLPYFAVPLLIGGFTGQLPGLLRVLACEVVVTVGLGLLVNGPPALAEARALVTWLATGTAIGLLGWYFHERVGGDVDASSYRDAIGLIQQLGALSGRLTGGLDPVTLAEQMMAEAEVSLPVQQAAVFTRSAVGEIAPLRYSTFASPSRFAGLDPLVEQSWRSEVPVVTERSGSSPGSQMAGIPVRSGSRTTGVLVLDLSHNDDPRALSRLQESLAPLALQLQAALLFDDVRAHATSEERNRLAREVHDGVAQDVASLGYVVDGLAASAEDERQRDQLIALRTEVTRVVAELRASVYDLRNEMRPGQGLGQGVSAFARQIGSRSDLTVHVRLDEGAARLRPDVEAELLRIAQEAMNNARKHSNGHNLWVSCTVRPPYVEIEIVDDGAGLQPSRSDSHGLRIMRERAEGIGARLEVQNLVGRERGTRLRVSLGGE